MKKVILIDGNNLLFRSYYATAYKGNILRNSKGFPTNALYGFLNMLNKIIVEMNPSYMMIAFDKGKTFRHEKYENYKDGRKETPLELKQQFPVAKELAKAMGIPCFEIDNYEADDIIGTFAKEVDINDEFIATIVSSDKDLLQLISHDVDVKLLKTNDYILMNEKTYFDTYQITPDKVPDLKGLMGDSSDNIPGVKGIGEKTALSLLQKYQDLEGIYNHIEELTPKVREKLLNDKENAFFSKELATIYKDVPIDKDLNKIKYEGIKDNYIEILREYEFFSIINKLPKQKKSEEITFKYIENLNDIPDLEYAMYLECLGSYHNKKILGLALYHDNDAYFIEGKNITNTKLFSSNIKKTTYDLKKLITILRYLNIEFRENYDDLMLISYLLNYEVKDDITSIANDEDILDIEKLIKSKEYSLELLAQNTIKKAKYIYDNKSRLYDNLNEEEKNLYHKIDLPLSFVLSKMEYNGVLVNKDILYNMKEDITSNLKDIEKSIYDLAGKEFNILSPKQLAKVLFEDLKIPYPKKTKPENYKTSSDILNKLLDYPIVRYVLEYRTLAKLYSNYIVGILDSIKEDGKIHTTFTQTLTRTGRLSSLNPNLQNIPVREEYGKLIRKAFIASYDSTLISSDYSQIELRIFAHMSEAENLISAFQNNLDIHTKTAMDIYHVSKDEVTSNMRRNAKAVNFGILYGISGFGLSEDLGISVKEAKSFIDNYLNTYPGINNYMKSLISGAMENGYVKTLFGRKRVIDELKNSNYMVKMQGERMALNTPIQGTGADILKKAMIEIDSELTKRNLKTKMIIQVHDELLFDCPKEELEEVTNLVRDLMENTYKLSVPLKVDINIGTNWYDAK